MDLVRPIGSIPSPPTRLQHLLVQLDLNPLHQQEVTTKHCVDKVRSSPSPQHTTPHHTTPYHITSHQTTAQHNTTHHNTTQHNTTQHNEAQHIVTPHLSPPTNHIAPLCTNHRRPYFSQVMLSVVSPAHRPVLPMIASTHCNARLCPLHCIAEWSQSGRDVVCCLCMGVW